MPLERPLRTGFVGWESWPKAPWPPSTCLAIFGNRYENATGLCSRALGLIVLRLLCCKFTPVYVPITTPTPVFSCHGALLQESGDAEILVGHLTDKCLLQQVVAGKVYRIHDLILDFAKVELCKSKELLSVAAARQARYLGRLSVVRGYASAGETLEGFYSLIALWRSIHSLSGDTQLEVEAYHDSLGQLEGGTATAETSFIFQAVGRLLQLQVQTTIQNEQKHLCSISRRACEVS